MGATVLTGLKMEEWCTKAHEIILAANFTRAVIDECVCSALNRHELGFRELADVFLEKLKVLNEMF
jgi:hypothetical protein